MHNVTPSFCTYWRNKNHSKQPHGVIRISKNTIDEYFLNYTMKLSFAEIYKYYHQQFDTKDNIDKYIHACLNKKLTQDSQKNQENHFNTALSSPM